MSAAWQIPQLTSNRVLQQLLTVAQLRRLLEVILPLRTSTSEEVLAFVAWGQRRNHGAYLAHKKRRETAS